MTPSLEPGLLVALLSSPSIRARQAAVMALEAHGEAAREALDAGTRHPDPGVRALCVVLLRRLGPNRPARATVWWRDRLRRLWSGRGTPGPRDVQADPSRA